MIRLTVLTIGKLKEKFWRDACEEYAKRLAGFGVKFAIEELAETRVADSPSAAQIAQTVESEGERLLHKLDPTATAVALCIEGKEMSSEALAAWIDSTAAHKSGNFVFVIGGSYGLSEKVKAKCDLRLSMSPMTFPHQLARVMLCEQLYRACAINAHTKYHK